MSIFFPTSRQRPLRAVLFDVDGTLVDSNDAHARAWVEAFAESGHGAAFEAVRPLIGMGGDKIVPALVGLSESSEEAARISSRATEIFARDYLRAIHPFPVVRELLQEVQLSGRAIAVATSAERQIVSELLKIAQVEQLVDVTVSKSEVEDSKPDADIIHAALEKLHVSAEEAILVGDTPYDVEAARRAGMETIALRCGGHSDEALQDAIAIYDSPAELLEKFHESPLQRNESLESSPFPAA